MTTPAPGSDTPTWTVDDDGWLGFDHNKVMIASWAQDPHHDANGTLRPDAYDALVADVRAARVHEGCTHTTDTLRRAYQRWRKAVDDDRTEDVLEAHAASVVGAVAELLAAEGPDHE